ncbi:Mss4-like protein [Amanita rubescens]|nr:Mss4-like protein [Amanita rubescens]
MQTEAQAPPHHEGLCLCGASKVIVDADPTFNVICHCEDCRKCNGTAFSSQVFVPETSVKVEGTYKTFDVTVPNGNVVTRWFCTGCGCQLIHKSPNMGKDICVQTGIIDAFLNLPIAVEVFVKDRWAGVSPAEGATQFEGMPIGWERE